DPRETVLTLMRDLSAGVAVGAVAARFHNALADATTAACIRLAGARQVGQVVLAGGTFANRALLARVSRQLRRAGLGVLVPERLPPGDGSISFGQAAAAAARLAA